MAVVAGIVALGTAAAATGAAAAAGSYGIYKYFKRRTEQRRRPSRNGENELDFGQELDVYKVTQTRIPPPVAPKPKREGRRATVAVVTKQPSREAREECSTESPPKGTCGGSSTATWPASRSGESFITRLCPNAVKVLPDPPKHIKPATAVATGGPAVPAAAAGVDSKRKSHDHELKAKDKDKDLGPQSNDVISMKTLQHNLEEEKI